MLIKKLFEYDEKKILKGKMIKELWCDWFEDFNRIERGKELINKLKEIKNTKKFDIGKTRILFKNNAFVGGYLYDDFRIIDKEGKVIFTIIPEIKTKSQVWSRSNNFKEPIVEGTWQDVLNYFNNNK